MIYFRRFSRHIAEPTSGNITLPTTTTQYEALGEGKSPYKTSTQVLVSSLEPHLRRNMWKYSYHRHKTHDIYPKVWGDRCATHTSLSKPRSKAIVTERVQRECSKVLV